MKFHKMKDIISQIEALYEFALNNPLNEYQIVDIFQIEAELSLQIQSATGVNVEGYWVSIDNYSIVHIILRHGNPVKEARHGQIAITKSDFIKLVDLLRTPDMIRLDTKIYRNGVIKETLIFSKEYDNYYVVAKEVRRVSKRGKSNRLILQTMYIRKKP